MSIKIEINNPFAQTGIAERIRMLRSEPEVRTFAEQMIRQYPQMRHAHIHDAIGILCQTQLEMLKRRGSPRA